MVFYLSAPEMEVYDESAWREMLRAPNTVGVLVEESPVLLSFEMHN